MTQFSSRSDPRSDVSPTGIISTRPDRGMRFRDYGLHASRTQDSKQTPVHAIFPDANANANTRTYNQNHNFNDKETEGYDPDEDNDFDQSTINTFTSWATPSTVNSTPHTSHSYSSPIVEDHSPRIPPLPNSPLSPRWDSLSYDKATALSPTSPAVSSLHSRSSGGTDELHLGIDSLASGTRDEFPQLYTKRMNTTETVRVDNFSRPRKPSIKQPYHDPLRPRPANYPQTESGHLDAASNHPLSWPRERGQSTSSNMSAATFASVPVRPSPEMYGREHPRQRGRQPGPPPTQRPPVSYNRAESSGPAVNRDPIPRMASLPTDELRSSYRSQLSASTAQGTVVTERSSVLTKSSSITSVYGPIDDGLSVDDVMGCTRTVSTTQHPKIITK